MVYVDPYIGSPDRQVRQLRFMVGASLLVHAAAIVLLLAFAGSKLFAEPAPPKPPKVYEVSLVSAVPNERPRALPNKVTSAPPPPAAPEVVSVAEPKAAEPKAAEPKVLEPKKPDPPKPEADKTEDLSQTLERLASLKDKFKTRPTNETPVPDAPVATINRPNAAEAGSQGSKSQLKSYKPDSAEGRYIGQIRAAVINAWVFNTRLAKEHPELLVIIVVEIAADGKLRIASSQDEAITRASGNTGFDQSALRAVRMVAQKDRFPDPPDALVGEIVELGFTPPDAR